MASHSHHQTHDHVHGPGCGHTAVRHDGHVDYIHDGHLHHQNGAGVEEHSIGVDGVNPSECDEGARGCVDHQHGPGCGHEAVPHGDHEDYLVDGRLHHAHDGHCDDHGPLIQA